jgi:hypothetical protein
MCHFIGVVTDNNLAGEIPVEKICIKFSSSLLIINRLSKVNELDVMRTVLWISVLISFVWHYCIKKYAKQLLIL